MSCIRVFLLSINECLSYSVMSVFVFQDAVLGVEKDRGGASSAGGPPPTAAAAQPNNNQGGGGEDEITSLYMKPDYYNF